MPRTHGCLAQGIARTVVLKLKTSEFKILTRSHTAGSPPASCEELTNIALSLLQRVGLSPHQRFRPVGVGLSNFCGPEDGPAQSALLPAWFERLEEIAFLC
jgi:DNA polymerase IV